jgi:8-oxo-dGTP pyrophosphatase MutT (NUDIX family)
VTVDTIENIMESDLPISAMAKFAMKQLNVSTFVILGKEKWGETYWNIFFGKQDVDRETLVGEGSEKCARREATEEFGAPIEGEFGKPFVHYSSTWCIYPLGVTEETTTTDNEFAVSPVQEKDSNGVTTVDQLASELGKLDL